MSRESIEINKCIYDKVMRSDPLLIQGELILVQKEIEKFGWNLVDELVESGELAVEGKFLDDDELYFLNLIKHINVRCVFSPVDNKLKVIK